MGRHGKETKIPPPCGLKVDIVSAKLGLATLSGGESQK
jgi:hypothetical protein